MKSGQRASTIRVGKQSPGGRGPRTACGGQPTVSNRMPTQGRLPGRSPNPILATWDPAFKKTNANARQYRGPRRKLGGCTPLTSGLRRRLPLTCWHVSTLSAIVLPALLPRTRRRNNLRSHLRPLHTRPTSCFLARPTASFGKSPY